MSAVKTEISTPQLFEDTKVAFSSKSDSNLRKTFWLFTLMGNVGVVNLGTFFIKLCLKLHLPVNKIIRNTIFEQFCGGETIADCKSTIENLGSSGIGTILDYSVEGGYDDRSFEETLEQLLLTIDAASQNPNIPFTVFKVSGLGSVELLEKVQNNKNSLSSEESQAYQLILHRVETLCRTAFEKHVRIFIDAEESWIQDVIDQLSYAMMEKFNKERTIVYNTYQLYRNDSLGSLKESYLKARDKGYSIGAKLVRGAYIEKEREKALENEYCDPIHSTKSDTDQDYNLAVDFCLDHLESISICLGTHNEMSCQHCIRKMSKLGLSNDDSRVWFAQLFGMSDNISYKLAELGYNVAKYVPYGPIESVMPYLFRRAAENKSIAGQSSREFLLIKREIERRRVEKTVC